MSIKIHHVACTVSDMDASIAWYQDVFGARLLQRYQKHGLEIAQVQIGDARIELFAGDAQPLPEYRKSLKSDIATIGTKHVALETENLDALVASLREKGVDFETQIDEAGFGGRYVFIKDPDGILIELYQC